MNKRMRGRMIISEMNFQIFALVFILVIDIFIICKFSTFDNPGFFKTILKRPVQGTNSFELLRIFENLSLAYIAALIFYLVVDYFPKKRKELVALKVISKELRDLYYYMDGVVHYIQYFSDVNDFHKLSNEDTKLLDDLCFDNSKKYLMVTPIRDGMVDGKGYTSEVDGKNFLINCGENIDKTMEIIYNSDVNQSLPDNIRIIISEIKISGLLKRLTDDMPKEQPLPNCEYRYNNFKNDFLKFFELYNKIDKYDFLKLGKSFRKATNEEIKNYIEYKKNTLTKHPELSDIIDKINH